MLYLKQEEQGSRDDCICISKSPLRVTALTCRVCSVSSHRADVREANTVCLIFRTLPLKVLNQWCFTNGNSFHTAR